MYSLLLTLFHSTKKESFFIITDLLRYSAFPKLLSYLFYIIEITSQNNPVIFI